MNALIFIYTDKPYYYSGEVVEGHITVQLTQPAYISDICLQVKGKEMSYFRKRERNPHKDEMVSVPYFNSNTLFDLKMSLLERGVFYHKRATFTPFSRANAYFQPAVYKFPFQFQLPLNLPGSFSTDSRPFTEASVRGSSISHGSVRYQLKVSMHHYSPSNDRGGIMKMDRPIFIHEPLLQALSAVELQKQGRISFLCCFSKGTTLLRLTYDKNAYAAGETVILQLHIDHSAGKVDLKAVNVRLYRKLTLSYSTLKYESDLTLEATNRSGPVLAGTVEHRLIQLPLPASTNASCHGKLVECTYFLSASLDVPWSPDVTVTCPIQIYMPSLPPSQAPLYHNTTGGSIIEFPLTQLSVGAY